MLGIEPRLRTLETPYNSAVHVLTPPPVFPVNWISHPSVYQQSIHFNSSLIRTSISNALQQLDMKSPIVINAFNPFFGLPLVGSFGEKLNLYYCYDEISAAGWTNKHGKEVEQKFMQRVHGVVTTSEALQSAKKQYNPNCFVVKNGVDFESFYRAADAKGKQDRKTIGYIGSIDERFDIETMRHAVQHLPEAKFVFTGRVVNQAAKDALTGFSNVEFHNPRKANEIPEVLRAIDVGIIPYLKNELTQGVYPLKINEYLAAGKAVVMTDFAHLPEFSQTVCFAGCKQTFAEGLREALATDSAEKKKERIEIARKNSWENRVEELSDVIEKLLDGKNAN